MGTKFDDRTLDRVADKEPIFVLRAQDLSADAVVLDWVQRNPDLPEYKAREAMETVLKMRAWPNRKVAD